MGQAPPPPWMPATPYFFEGGPAPAVPGPAPPYVQHMCTTMPPPQIAVSSAPGGKSGAGAVRATPSPHAPPHSSNTTTVMSSTSAVVSSSEIPPQNYEVEYHLHQGEVISFQLGDGRVEIIPGKKLLKRKINWLIFVDVV